MITGAGAPGAPGIIKSLRLNGEREIRIIGVDADIENAVGVGLVDKAYRIPPAESQDFVGTILSICKTENVEVLLPLVTRELSVFAKNTDRFLENAICIQVSDYKSLQIANNKFELMKTCQTIGVPSPDFYHVNSIDGFIEKAHLLGYPENKICFKPPISNGLRGFRIIDDSESKMYSLINEKPNNLFIGFNEFLEIAKSSNFFPELLVMEYLPGQEYSVDALADHGKCICVIPRTRDKIKMGITFAGTTVCEKAIIEYSTKLIEYLGLNGNVGLQFKRDRNGIPRILESNPRVQGTIVLCTASGYNMVYNSIKLGLGEIPLEPMIKWGTKMIRFWDEIYCYDGNTFRLN